MLKGEKGEYQAKNIIIATGAHARPIGCKGEAEFLGRGVFTVQLVTRTSLKILKYM